MTLFWVHVLSHKQLTLQKSPHCQLNRLPINTHLMEYLRQNIKIDAVFCALKQIREACISEECSAFLIKLLRYSISYGSQ